MALSEYDKQFAEAMVVKLKLSRLQTSKTSATSAASGELSAPTGEIHNRELIMEQELQRRPGLTKEKL